MSPSKGYELYILYQEGQSETVEVLPNYTIEKSIFPAVKFNENQPVRFRLVAVGDCGKSAAAITTGVLAYSVPDKVEYVRTSTKGSSCYPALDTV